MEHATPIFYTRIPNKPAAALRLMWCASDNQMISIINQGGNLVKSHRYNGVLLWQGHQQTKAETAQQSCVTISVHSHTLVRTSGNATNPGIPAAAPSKAEASALNGVTVVRVIALHVTLTHPASSCRITHTPYR